MDTDQDASTTKNTDQKPLLTPQAQARAERNLAPITTIFASIGLAHIGQAKLRHWLVETFVEGVSGERVPIESILATTERFRSAKPNEGLQKSETPQMLIGNRKQTRDELVILQCAAWLRLTVPLGQAPKKSLSKKAREHFGSKLTDRNFNAAYKLVFNRLRGRPRREK